MGHFLLFFHPFFYSLIIIFLSLFIGVIECVRRGNLIVDEEVIFKEENKKWNIDSPKQAFGIVEEETNQFNKRSGDGNVIGDNELYIRLVHAATNNDKYVLSLDKVGVWKDTEVSYGQASIYKRMTNKDADLRIQKLKSDGSTIPTRLFGKWDLPYGSAYSIMVVEGEDLFHPSSDTTLSWHAYRDDLPKRKNGACGVRFLNGLERSVDYCGISFLNIKLHESWYENTNFGDITEYCSAGNNLKEENTEFSRTFSLTRCEYLKVGDLPLGVASADVEDSITSITFSCNDTESAITLLAVGQLDYKDEEWKPTLVQLVGTTYETQYAPPNLKTCHGE